MISDSFGNDIDFGGEQGGLGGGYGVGPMRTSGGERGGGGRGGPYGGGAAAGSGRGYVGAEQEAVEVFNSLLYAH